MISATTVKPLLASILCLGLTSLGLPLQVARLSGPPGVAMTRKSWRGQQQSRLRTDLARRLGHHLAVKQGEQHCLTMAPDRRRGHELAMPFRCVLPLRRSKVRSIAAAGRTAGSGANIRVYGFCRMFICLINTGKLQTFRTSGNGSTCSSSSSGNGSSCNSSSYTSTSTSNNNSSSSNSSFSSTTSSTRTSGTCSSSCSS